MSEPKKCPKCGGEMVEGKDLGEAALRKKGDWIGDRIIPFYCTNCGFIELYKELH